jgi:hypothetical protein
MAHRVLPPLSSYIVPAAPWWWESREQSKPLSMGGSTFATDDPLLEVPIAHVAAALNSTYRPKEMRHTDVVVRVAANAICESDLQLQDGFQPETKDYCELKRSNSARSGARSS